jgi:predicted enzyme related to lactoylglutathione lyase
MSAAEFDLVTIDTTDPRSLAAFWQAALDLVEIEDEDDGRWLVLAEPGGPRRIGLQRIAEPVSSPGRLHLDLVCTPEQFDAEVMHLVSIGAELLDPVRIEPYGSIANLADPDGNRFDLCAYR